MRYSTWHKLPEDLGELERWQDNVTDDLVLMHTEGRDNSPAGENLKGLYRRLGAAIEHARKARR